MPELTFQIEGAEPERFAAAPLLLFQMRVDALGKAVPIHSIALRCQIRIEPGRRRYSPAQKEKLLDLFGTPERWGQTVRDMPWIQAGVMVPSFEGSIRTMLPVPCTYDFNVAATKYFDALDDGSIPLCFLFSGTIFYEAEEGGVQAVPIPWDREATFSLPAATWKNLMNEHYPNSAWIYLHKDVFDRLNQFKTRTGIPTWEQTVEKLLSAAEIPSPLSPNGTGAGSEGVSSPLSPNGRGAGGEGVSL